MTAFWFDPNIIRPEGRYSFGWIDSFIYHSRCCGDIESHTRITGGRCPKHPDQVLVEIKGWRFPRSSMEKAYKEGRIKRRTNLKSTTVLGRDLIEFLDDPTIIRYRPTQRENHERARAHEAPAAATD